MAAQALRPDTWCRESTEKLGRAAAAALAAAGGVAEEATGEGRGAAGNETKRGGGAGRVGSDGLRRCGRPRPEMFKPTAVAKRVDGVIDRRRKGEVRRT